MDSTPQRGRNKDKVAALASLSSPPRPKSNVPPATYSDTKSVSTASTSASSRRRDELPQHILKQLAKDIEANGGIATFGGTSHKLAKLLDRRSDLYGRRAEKIRVRIQKKVYRWQELNKAGTYAERVLSKFKVQSAANRKPSKRKNNIPSRSAGEEDEDDSSLSSSTTTSDNSVAAGGHINQETPAGGNKRRQKELPIKNLREENFGDFNVRSIDFQPSHPVTTESLPWVTPKSNMSKYPGVPEGTGKHPQI